MSRLSMRSAATSHGPALRGVVLRGVLKEGSSMPLVVDAADGSTWVVKTTGAGDGALALVTESVALRLAGRLGLPIPEPRFVALDGVLLSEGMDPEIRELIERSFGVNLGTRRIEGARVWRPEDEVEEELRDLIFLYDLLVLNIDRSVANPDVFLAQGRLRCLDYGASMMLRAMAEGRRFDEEPLLRRLRPHPFYRPGVDRHELIRRTREVREEQVDEIVEELPATWLGGAAKERLSTGVKAALRGAHALIQRRLDRLRIMVAETEDTRRERIRRNREAFEDLIAATKR